jgi:hypothetical protein
MTENIFSKTLEKGENVLKEIQDNHIILNNHSFFVNSFWSYFHGK